jgi:lipoprotein-releasing system permease protein
MGYAALIGRRTVLSRENRLLINLTTWIAVVGVALGVAALVVVNAVYDGYIAEINTRFINVLAHLDLQAAGRPTTSADPHFLNTLEAQPGVVAATPIVSRPGLLMARDASNTRRVGAFVLGVDVERAPRVSEILNAIVAGDSDPGPDGAVLGAALAERLGVGVGDAVVLVSDVDTSGARPRPRMRTLRVVGLTESGFYQFDRTLVYVRIETARELYGVPPLGADAIQMRLEDPWQADAVAASLARLNGRRFLMKTWRERWPDFFQGVEMTRVVLLLILFLLIAVASTNVIGSLVMIVNDRTRQIGILRAMGATRLSLARIYLLCGLFIGVLGVIVGFVFAALVCGALSQWDLITIPASVYFIDSLPVSYDWVKIAFVALATVLICLVASAVPALRAAHLDPVQALRHE